VHILRDGRRTSMAGTGTSLDTSRFRFHLGKRFNVSASDVEALVLGEHGVSSVFLRSSARVGGREVSDLFGESSPPQTVREELEREVRYANITIIEGIRASQCGLSSRRRRELRK